MTIGTSDGEQFNSHFEHMVSLVDNAPKEEPVSDSDPAFTHKAEDPSWAKAKSYIDTAAAFAKGGVMGALKEQGVETPEIANKAYNVLQNESVQTSLGLIGGMGSMTANLSRLKMADELAVAGKSKNEIYAQTGWYRDIDKEWKYEIPDTNSKIKTILDKQGQPDFKNIPTTVGELLEHNKLYEAYPGARDINIKWDAAERTGAYVHENNTVHLNPNEKPKEMQSILLHELQHHIQSLENFARGGNPNWMLSVAESKYGSRDFWSDEMYNKVVNAAHESYLRLKGETEARNVMHRWEDPRALAHPPYVTEDRTPAVQIPIKQYKDLRRRYPGL